MSMIQCPNCKSMVDNSGAFCPNCGNLAAGRLKLSVFILQILKLGGADKGKVCGVEEEQAPLAQHILLGHGPKLSVLICLCGKIADFFVNK